MNDRDVSVRFRNGQQTKEDLVAIRDALRRDDRDFLSNIIPAYLKYSESIDENAVVEYVKSAHFSPIAAEIISGMARRGTRRDDFRAFVEDVANGVPWDFEDTARMAALFALCDIIEDKNTAVSIIRGALSSPNPVVVDAALVAAQRYCGISEDKIIWGSGDGTAMQHMPMAVRRWLGVGDSGSFHAH